MSNETPTEAQKSQDEYGPTATTTGVVESRQAIETGKTAVSDMFRVLKFIWQNPAEGLQVASYTLGDTRVFYAGIGLCLFFVLICWIAVQKIFSLIAGFFGVWSFGFAGRYGELGVSDHFRILLSAAIPVLGMIGLLWGVKKLFRGAGNYKQFTLVAGAALTPITFFLFLLWLLGNSSTELVSLIGFFCITTFILFLYMGLFGVLRLSSRNALLLVPTLLVTDLFFMKVMFEVLY